MQFITKINYLLIYFLKYHLRLDFIWFIIICFCPKAIPDRSSDLSVQNYVHISKSSLSISREIVSISGFLGLSRSSQLLVVTSSYSSDYWLGSALLNFSARSRTNISMCYWCKIFSDLWTELILSLFRHAGKAVICCCFQNYFK